MAKTGTENITQTTGPRISRKSHLRKPEKRILHATTDTQPNRVVFQISSATNEQKMPHQPTLIGWKESIDLPDWGIRDITAKADSGARRSAIDVENIVELPGNKVQFDVAANRRTGQLRKTIIADIAHQTHVRSSNGQQHERYFVTTSVQVGDVVKEIELSLSNRKHMQCRMLLGRLALETDFLVDCSKTFLTRPNRKPKVAH